MAGFFGIGDFTKEGKGVDKNAPKKRGFFAFFELFFRKFGKLCKLNILYLLACIPTLVVVFFLAGLISSSLINLFSPTIADVLGLPAPDMTNVDFVRHVGMFDLIIRVLICLLFTVFWGMGPVTAGYTYILRNYAREEHAWMWSDFWQHTKENFKQAIVVWIVDLFALVALFYAYMFYSSMSGFLNYLKYVVGSIILIYTMMHFYIYPMMVMFKLSIKNIYRNAVVFSMMKLPLNLLVFLILILIHIGIPFAGISGLQIGAMPIYWLAYALLELLIFVSMSGFIVNFSVYPSLKKYMIINVDSDIKSE